MLSYTDKGNGRFANSEKVGSGGVEDVYSTRLVDTADAEGQGTVQNLCSKVTKIRASLVVQWLSICLLMQGILVRSLVWEDPTCCGTTKLMSCNYSACTP